MPQWIGLVCLFHFHQLNYERGQDLVDTFGDLSLNSSADGDDVPTKHDPSDWLNGQSRYVRRSDHKPEPVLRHSHEIAWFWTTSISSSWVGWPGGIAPPGSHRFRRESLDSPGSSHPSVSQYARTHFHWANRAGCLSISPVHHRLNRLWFRNRRYFFPAQRLR